jgi:hypothetical protein
MRWSIAPTDEFVGVWTPPERGFLRVGVTPLWWPNSETSLLCGYHSAGLQFIAVLGQNVPDDIRLLPCRYVACDGR